MSKYIPITADHFRGKSWKPSPDLKIAAQDAVCALTVQELPNAIMSMPAAFIKLEDQFDLVAVQSLQAGSNYYVSPSNTWLGGYVPAIYRSFPFALLQNEAAESQLVLCIDEDSNLIEDNDEHESFVTENAEEGEEDTEVAADGEAKAELSPALKDVLEFLTNLNAGRISSRKIVQAVSEHRLIKPWELQIQLETGPQNVEGLYCIDEQALNQLSDVEFLAIKNAGALPLIYCQLLSMSHVVKLAQFANVKSREESEPATTELNLDGLTDDGSLSFDNF
jgi:hypothetical protein